jgi:hypothetical protein
MVLSWEAPEKPLGTQPAPGTLCARGVEVDTLQEGINFDGGLRGGGDGAEAAEGVAEEGTETTDSAEVEGQIYKVKLTAQRAIHN